MKNLIVAIMLVAGFSACNRSTDTIDTQLMNDSTPMYSDKSSDMEIIATPTSQSRSVISVLPRTTTQSPASTNSTTVATTSRINRTWYR